MRHTKRFKNNERGIALIVALFVIVILSTLAALLTMSTQTEVLSSANYRKMMQARYTAEAGLQNGLNWFAYHYTPGGLTGVNQAAVPATLSGNPVILSNGSDKNFPDSAVLTSFNNALYNKTLSASSDSNMAAKYTVTAKLIDTQSNANSSSETWQLNSVGSITGSVNATEQLGAKIKKTTGSSLYTYGAFATSTACHALNIDGNVTTDSYDSSAGTYAATHLNSGGNMGTNGNMQGDSGDNIQGTLVTTKTAVSGSGCSVALNNVAASAIHGGIVKSPTNIVFPTPTMPAGTNITTAYNISAASVTLAPGNYGNISYTGTGTVHLSVGVYNINSYSTSDSSKFVLDSGPVTINIWGTSVATPFTTGGPIRMNMDVATGAIPNLPKNLVINYAGTGTLNFGDDWRMAGIINAPNASVNIGNSGQLYGALISSTFRPTSSTQIHYDRSLGGSNGGSASTVGTTFSWSKF